MPPKIRELITDLEAAGFENFGSKGSHRNYEQPKTKRRITVFGKLGNDAKPYQIKDVKEVIQESKE
jgi:predicted RNA binding protein YcfA (HicA-like mRNA interferase family)